MPIKHTVFGHRARWARVTHFFSKYLPSPLCQALLEMLGMKET